MREQHETPGLEPSTLHTLDRYSLLSVLVQKVCARHSTPRAREEAEHEELSWICWVGPASQSLPFSELCLLLWGPPLTEEEDGDNDATTVLFVPG